MIGRILSQLGAGGMGVVYKAKDIRLDRLVALKFLPPQFASTEELKRRFVNEARAASALDHSNICTIHEIDETEDGHLFIVMALYEGESLQQRISRGPLSPVEALRIGIHVAEGLAAAHERGILHRDIKPGNIFITASDTVKILDFGLAKVSGAIKLTRSGTSMGTLSYMPPEQLRGEGVDQRSDLFSLGAVLYEMLVGQPAFDGDNEGAVLNRVLNQNPQPPSSRRPGLTPGFDRVVEKALAKDPAGRYPTAMALRADLEALQAEAADADEQPTLLEIPEEPILSVTGPAAAGREHAPDAIGPRRWLRVTVLAALLVLGGVAVLWRMEIWSDGRGTAEEPISTASVEVSEVSRKLGAKRVLVAPFENRTGDPSLDNLGLMAADWITRGLAQTGMVEAVSPITAVGSARFVAQETGTTGEQERIAALAEDTGAGTVITGAFYRQGEEILISAEVTDTVSMQLLSALEPARAPIETPLAAVERLQSRITAAVAAHLDARLASLARPSQLPDYEAYSEYSRGLELFTLMDFRGAVEHWRRANDVDPDFIQPLLPAAMALLNLGEWEESDALVQEVAPHRSSLSVLDQLFLDRMVSTFEHDYDGALESMRRSADLNPQGPGAFDAGALALITNRPREAADRLDAIDYQRGFYRGFVPYWHFLTEACHLTHEQDRELERALRARELHPNLLSAVWWEARARISLGDLGGVGALMEEAVDAVAFNHTPGSVMVATSGELAAHGFAAEAVRIAESALGWYSTQLEANGSDLARRAGRAKALFAAAMYEEAEAEFAALSREDPDGLTFRGYRGVLAARRGDSVTAQQISSWFEQLDRSYLWGAPYYWRAAIAAWGGDEKRALQIFRDSAVHGRALAGVVPPPHSDVVLQPLWDYPPFQQFLEPKG